MSEHRFPRVELQELGVALYDCEHATPADEGKGFPYIAIPNIRDGRLDLSGVRRIGRSQLEKWNRRVTPRGGDIILTRRGRVGDTAVVPDWLDCSIGQNLVLLRSESDAVSQGFLRWALRGPFFKAEVQRLLNVGAVFDSLNCADIPRIQIFVPPPDQQRAISEVLGALDDKIESNRRLWSLTLQLLDAALLEVAENNDCTAQSLGDVVEFNRSTLKPGPPESDLVYIDIAGVSPGVINNRQRMSWSDAPSRARRGVADGDIIFSTVRPGRRSFSVILDPEVGTVASTGFAVLTPRTIGTAFLLGTVAAPDFAEYCESVSQGSAYPAVSAEALSIFEVLIPDVAVLGRFESEMMPVLRRGHRALLENDVLSALRDALLPELLSGRIRVPEPRQLVGDAS